MGPRAGCMMTNRAASPSDSDCFTPDLAACGCSKTWRPAVCHNLAYCYGTIVVAISSNGLPAHNEAFPQIWASLIEASLQLSEAALGVARSRVWLACSISVL